YPISAEDESAVRLERFFLYASDNARCRTIATVCQGNLTEVRRNYDMADPDARTPVALIHDKWREPGRTRLQCMAQAADRTAFTAPAYWMTSSEECPMRAFMAICFLILSTAAMAAANDAAVPSGTMKLRQLNGISYISGGVGIDEAATIRGMARQFNVRMHFVDNNDNSSLSDVTVTLFNARREIVLLVLSEGPYLYMNLPRGAYRAVIRYGGSIVSRSIAVTGDSAPVDLLLRFPAMPPGSDSLIARPVQGQFPAKSR
ncbi:hypothetical protein, partial [Cupriavidus pinatubonensis]